MTPPEWRRLLYSGGDEDPKRILVLETLNGLTEIAYCPPDVAISHFDYDEADELSRAGVKEDAAHAEVERARERVKTIVDERAAIDLLAEFWERAEREGDGELMGRIDAVLAPVTVFISDGDEVSYEEYRRRREAGEE